MARFLTRHRVTRLLVSAAASPRAVALLYQYGLAHGLGIPDALIGRHCSGGRPYAGHEQSVPLAVHCRLVPAPGAVSAAPARPRPGGALSRVYLTLALGQVTLYAMELARAQESIRAAGLCIQAGLVHSAVSRAYYAMFQAAQVALEMASFTRPAWSHSGLQALFTAALIHRRKRYPATLRDYLASALVVRQAADYGCAGVSQKIAQRMVRRAAPFVTAVEGAIQR